MSASVKPSSTGISKNWVVSKFHSGIYSGGKAVVSRNCDYLACIYHGNVVFVNLESGNLIKTLKPDDLEDNETIITFCLHPNGKEIVTAQQNLLLRQWNIETGKCLNSIRSHESPVLDMDYDGTGTLVATGSSDRTLKVWDIEKGYCTHNFRDHTGIITCVKFHPNRQTLQVISASDDHTVRVWDLVEQKCKAVLSDHLSIVTSISFTNDGFGMLTGGRDQVINFWDLRNFSLLRTLAVFEPVEGLQILPSSCFQNFEEQYQHTLTGDSKSKRKGTSGYFAYVGTKGTVNLWRFESEKIKGDDHSIQMHCQSLISQQVLHANSGFFSLLFVTKTQQLIAVTQDHNFLFLNCATLAREKQIIGYNDEILDLKYFYPNNKNNTNIENEESNKLIEPNGSVIVATNSPQVRIFDVNTFNCTTLEAHTDIVLAVDGSIDGRFIASGSKDGIVIIWQYTSSGTFEPIMKCVGHTEHISALTFSKKKTQYDISQGFVITTSSDKTIKKWILDKKYFCEKQSENSFKTFEPTAKCSVRGHEKDVNAVTIAPNDALIATASQDKTVKLWNSKDLTLFGVLSGHKRSVWKVSFSPVDRVVATCSGDTTIKIWSLADFSCLKTFQGHTSSVLNVQFINRGIQLISSGADGLVKLWTIRTNECENTFDNHNDKIWALAVSANGEQFATGGSDSIINFWRDVTVEEEEKKIAMEEEKLIKEQQMTNYLFKKDYQKAIDLAFELDHPLRLWKILVEIVEETSLSKEPNVTYSDKIGQYVVTWDVKKLSLAFKYIRDWNTNSKQSVIAQSLLHCIFERVPLDELQKVDKINEVVDGIIAYSERHYQRLDKLNQASFLSDFTISCMKMEIPRPLLSNKEGKKLNEKTQIKKKTHSTRMFGEVFDPTKLLDDANETEGQTDHHEEEEVENDDVMETDVIKNDEEIENTDYGQNDDDHDGDDSDKEEDNGGKQKIKAKKLSIPAKKTFKSLTEKIKEKMKMQTQTKRKISGLKKRIPVKAKIQRRKKI